MLSQNQKREGENVLGSPTRETSAMTTRVSQKANISDADIHGVNIEIPSEGATGVGNTSQSLQRGFSGDKPRRSLLQHQRLSTASVSGSPDVPRTRSQLSDSASKRLSIMSELQAERARRLSRNSVLSLQRERRSSIMEAEVREFSQMKARLESLWEEVKIPVKDRSFFKSQFMTTVNLQNSSALKTELSVVTEFEKVTSDTLRKISARETAVASFAQLVGKYDARFYRKDAVKTESDRIVSAVRETTINVIHAIQKWKSHQAVSNPFPWKTHKSYCRKIISDFQALHLIKNEYSKDFLSPVGDVHFIDILFASNEARGSRYATIQERFRGTAISLEGIETVFEALLILFVMLDKEKLLASNPSSLFMLSKSPMYMRYLALSLRRAFTSYQLRTRINRSIREKFATMVLQRFWRRVSAVKILKTLKLKKRSATRIQAWIRCKHFRFKLRKQWMHAIKIQTNYRKYMAKRLLKEMKLKKTATTKIQCFTRVYLAQIKVKKLNVHYKVALIQSCFRSFRVTQEVNVRRKEKFQVDHLQREQALLQQQTKERISAAALQNWTRGINARRFFCKERPRMNAARRIQAIWRGLQAKRMVQLLRKKFKAACIIQCKIRSYLAKKYYKSLKNKHDQYVEKHEKDDLFVVKIQSACVIQRVVRKFLAVLRVNRERKQYTAYIQHYIFLREQNTAAIVIQCFVRRELARRHYVHNRLAFKILSRTLVPVARMWAHRVRLKRYRAVLQISYFRIHCLALRGDRKLRDQETEIKNSRRFNAMRETAAALIQSLYRKVKARKRSRMRRMRAQLESWIKRQNDYATVIQACYRGYVARKAYALTVCKC